MISLRPLSPDRVLSFLPPNSWTEVILLSTPQNNIHAYVATTEEKLQKRWQDMNEMSIQSCLYEPVLHFKAREIVAVKIDENWYRGKLIQLCLFNPESTTIELIDVGVTYKTNLQNVFDLPYYFKYDPLTLPIKFKNFIPKTSKVFVKPCISDCNLAEGFVLVEAHSSHIKLEKGQQYDKSQSDTKQVYKNKKVIKGIKCESNDDTAIKSSSHMEQNRVTRSNQHSHSRNCSSSTIRTERDRSNNGPIYSRSIKTENDTSLITENPNEIMSTNKHSFTDESYTTNASLHRDQDINNIDTNLPAQKLIKRKKSNVKNQEESTPHNRKNSRKKEKKEKREKKEKKESKKQLAQNKNQQKQEQASQSKSQGKNLTEEIRYRFEQLVKFTSQQLQDMNYYN